MKQQHLKKQKKTGIYYILTLLKKEKLFHNITILVFGQIQKHQPFEQYRKILKLINLLFKFKLKQTLVNHL